MLSPLATPDDRGFVAAIEKLVGAEIPRFTVEGMETLEFNEDDGKRRRGGRARVKPEVRAKVPVREAARRMGTRQSAGRAGAAARRSWLRRSRSTRRSRRWSMSRRLPMPWLPSHPRVGGPDPRARPDGEGRGRSGDIAVRSGPRQPANGAEPRGTEPSPYARRGAARP